jgi:hypothetical protein
MQTIAWDVDDVLNDLMREWFERAFLIENPASRASYAELCENPPHHVLGIERHAYLDSLDNFRLAHGAQLAPNPELIGWFERHGDSFRHQAITATPLATAPISAAWVLRHFGRWIRTISIVPSPRPADRSKRWDIGKLDMLRAVGGARVLVDDTPKNLLGAELHGVRPLLFPRPWNTQTATVSALLAQIGAS